MGTEHRHDHGHEGHDHAAHAQEGHDHGHEGHGHEEHDQEGHGHQSHDEPTMATKAMTTRVTPGTTTTTMPTT